ncbi:hypothetical protein [Atlantibacter hermannii]|uniref:hypothetical protein n=1 Tax=Atlantibacter hermannii TaxID=565 RepID=UPI0028A6F9C4|nr:hypothetical protein [Atlantibacter hermannii]
MTQLQEAQNLNKVIFDGLYSRILHVVARALSQTKLFAFDIEYLQGENPSYKERADLLSDVHSDMQKVAEVLEFEYQADVIGEYIVLMHEMADAIDAGDEEKLQAAIRALDKKPFICM